MVLAIEGIDRIAKDPFIHQYIEEAFGGIDTLKKSTLQPSIFRVELTSQLFSQTFLNMRLMGRARIVTLMQEVVLTVV